VTRYEITVNGTIGPVVSAAAEGFEAAPAPLGRSRLVGDVIDQAALHGLLNRLYDLHVEIIDVHRLDEA